jgi:hypothetical protein
LLFIVSDNHPFAFDRFLIIISLLFITFTIIITLRIIASWTPYLCLWSLSDHHAFLFVHFLITMPFSLFTFWLLSLYLWPLSDDHPFVFDRFPITLPLLFIALGSRYISF